MTASCPFRCYLNQKENAGSRLFHASRKGGHGCKYVGSLSVVALVYQVYQHRIRHDNMHARRKKLGGKIGSGKHRQW